jgi:hypothetical protein
MIFVKEVFVLPQTRPVIIEENATMNILDVMREIGRRWRIIGEPEKEYFQKKADIDKTRFNIENSLYFEQRKKIEQE